MLRAISEMAVAIMVRSLPTKPMLEARSRPFWRAAMISPSWAKCSSVASCPTLRALAHAGGQEFQALFEIERGGYVLERQAELNHRNGYVRKDPDDNHFGAPQFRGLGDSAQRPRRKRVHDVEHADIDHDPARAQA